MASTLPSSTTLAALRAQEHDAPQLSDEWFRIRLGRVSASEGAYYLTWDHELHAAMRRAFPHIEDKQLLKFGRPLVQGMTYQNAIAQKAKNILNPQQRSADNIFTDHGKRYEHVAVQMFAQRGDVTIHHFGYVASNKYDFLGCSPDGVIESPTHVLALLEIKCPLRRVPSTTCMPVHYWVQCQIQLAVCGLETCHFYEAVIANVRNIDEMTEGSHYGACVLDPVTRQHVYMDTPYNTRAQIETWLADQQSKNPLYLPFLHRVVSTNEHKLRRDDVWLEHAFSVFRKVTSGKALSVYSPWRRIHMWTCRLTFAIFSRMTDVQDLVKDPAQIERIEHLKEKYDKYLQWYQETPKFV